MGRELPDEVLACDQRICWWLLAAHGRARGRMDELRRVPGPGPRATPPRAPGLDAAIDGQAADDSVAAARCDATGRGSGRVRGAVAGRVTLTVPLVPYLLADRPGELGGHGPVDPWLPDLNAVWLAPRQPGHGTDQHGHAVGRLRTARTKATERVPGRRRGRVHLYPASRDGAWRVRHLALRVPGGPDLIVRSTPQPDPASTSARPGPDPGVRLRHRPRSARDRKFW
jgi:hypothetical protein